MILIKLFPSAAIASSVAALVYYVMHAAASGIAGSLALVTCLGAGAC